MSNSVGSKQPNDSGLDKSGVDPTNVSCGPALKEDSFGTPMTFTDGNVTLNSTLSPSTLLSIDKTPLNTGYIDVPVLPQEGVVVAKQIAHQQDPPDEECCCDLAQPLYLKLMAVILCLPVIKIPTITQLCYVQMCVH